MPVLSVYIVDCRQVNVQLVNILPNIMLFKNSIEKKTTKSTKLILNYHKCIVRTPSPLPLGDEGSGGGGLIHFSEHLSKRDLG